MTIDADPDAMAAGARAKGDKAALVVALWKIHDRDTGSGRKPAKTLYFELTNSLIHLKRWADGAEVATAGVAAYPKNADLRNMLGICWRRLGKIEMAIAQFDFAQKLAPKSLSPVVNRGSALLDAGDGTGAARDFERVVRAAPREGEYHRLLGRAWLMAGEYDKARRHLSQACALSPRDANVWIDLAGLHVELVEYEVALAALDKAIGIIGLTDNLISPRLLVLRLAGRREEALAWLVELERNERFSVLSIKERARTLVDHDRPAANAELERALALAPRDREIMIELAHSLNRTRGPEEPRNIDRAFRLVKEWLTQGWNPGRDLETLSVILVRCADFEALEQLGTFAERGDAYARTNRITGLHGMLGQVSEPVDRRKLLEWHRRCARSVELAAARTPLPEAPAIGGRAKIRIGFMSSDLRNHPVSYFAEPLLRHYDRSRFEFYCYSWNHAGVDPIQTMLSELVDSFRHVPHIGNREAAELIRGDGLDMLFELGGSTEMNKLEVMAWRPARRQASWLGYPHSAGYETIDRLLVDPWIMPPDPALIMEKPFAMKRSWVCFEQPGFGRLSDIVPETPQARNGHITFGTMNNPMKYNRSVLATWARIVAAVPDARFHFVRPEGGVPAFRENICAAFGREGVAPERVAFMPARGNHLQYYNAIDVALDTFPQTGGTTTCETLWMGVPVVSLAGEAFFERLSLSNLHNAGLGDWAVDNIEAYIAKALALAGDESGRAAFRREARGRIASHALGNGPLFARDFEESAKAWMDEAP